MIEKTKEDIATLGYQDVLLKGDGEPALAQVLEDVELAREAPSIIQHSPAYDPQGNGVADKAAQSYQGQERTMKIGLETRLNCKVQSDWKITEWITEFAGELLSRGKVGKDGRTEYILIVRQEQRQSCPGDRRTGDGQTLEGSQIQEEVVFEGTLGVRDVGGY